MSLYIMHYGVGHDKGGHSGRYPWGSGKRPYGGKKIFVSGASKTGDPESEYYGEPLPNAARKIILDTAKFGDHILVGDAPGVDRQVQDLLKNYKNVIVYTINDKPRYIANKNWKVKTIKSNDQVDKDKAMANDADGGIAIPIVGRSQKTRDNVERLLQQNKEVKVFEIKKVSDIYPQERGKKEIRSKTKNYIETIKSLSDEEFKLFSDGGNSKKDDIKFIKEYVKTLPNYKDTRAFISKYGNVTLASLETNGLGQKEWNIGWATNPKYRGTGITQSNIKETIEWIRKYSDLPITATIEIKNIPSQKTAQKAGFKDSGYTRMNDGSIRKRYVYN